MYMSQFVFRFICLCDKDFFSLHCMITNVKVVCSTRAHLELHLQWVFFTDTIDINVDTIYNVL